MPSSTADAGSLIQLLRLYVVIVIGIFKPQRREITFQSVNTFSPSLPNPSTRNLERKAVVAGGEPWLASHSLHPLPAHKEGLQGRG